MFVLCQTEICQEKSALGGRGHRILIGEQPQANWLSQGLSGDKHGMWGPGLRNGPSQLPGLRDGKDKKGLKDSDNESRTRLYPRPPELNENPSLRIREKAGSGFSAVTCEA